MTWVKIDDKLPNHGKVEALSDRAFRIYVTSICYSSANLTDGEITKGSLTKIGATPKIAEALVAAGLWDTTSRGGWAVHDYLVYNRSKLRVKAISEVHILDHIPPEIEYRDGQAYLKDDSKQVVI